METCLQKIPCHSVFFCSFSMNPNQQVARQFQLAGPTVSTDHVILTVLMNLFTNKMTDTR